MKTKSLLKAALTGPLRWGVAKVRVRIRGSRRSSAAGISRALVIGHRGFPALAPENTLPSFEFALAAGVDMVELDCRQTLDGHLIVFHDPYLDRTTDARLQWSGKKIKVETKTLAEIRGLDAGEWFDPKFAGTRVPLLSEALELIQGRAIALVERKSGDPETYLRALQDSGTFGRVIIQSFDWHFLNSLHTRLPQQPVAALGPLAGLPGAKKAPGVFGQLNRRWLKALKRTGASVAVWNKQVSRAAIRQAHEQGLKVWVYTIDRPELARRLLAVGVDGLITNNPALIWKTMASR